MSRSRRVGIFLVLAVLGYGAAIGTGGGALFALAVGVGIVGEVGLWAEVVRWWRRPSRGTA